MTIMSEQATADLIPSDTAVAEIQSRNAEYTLVTEFELAIVINRLEREGELGTDVWTAN